MTKQFPSHLEPPPHTISHDGGGGKSSQRIGVPLGSNWPMLTSNISTDLVVNKSTGSSKNYIRI